MRVTPCSRLERVSGTHFDDPVSVVIVGITERLAVYARTRMVCIGGVGQHTIAEAHFQVVIAIIERQQIVVQEVECCDPEFNILPLADLEALEQRDVAVPEHRTRHVGNAPVADLSWSGQREAIRVHKLILL